MPGDRTTQDLIFGISALVALSLAILYFAAVLVKDFRVIPPSSQIDLQAARTATADPAFVFENLELRVKFPATDRPILTLPFQGSFEKQKLRVTFADNYIGNLKYLLLRGQSADGSSSFELTLKLSKGHGSFDFALPDVTVNGLSIEFFGTGRQVVSAMTDIAIVPRLPADTRFFVLPWALLVAIVILLPGLLMFSAIVVRPESDTVFPLTVCGLSVLFYFVLYLVLQTGHSLSIGRTQELTVFASLVLFLVLLIANYRKDRFCSTARLLKSNADGFFIYLVATCILAYLISYDTHLPFQNLNWQSISGPKTFEAFRAHDNYFQFANGRVIAENLPFSAEYGFGRRLVHLPQDRGILPGAMYAGFRSVASWFSPYLGKSFLSYTIFGTAFNLMVLFPLIAFCRRYAPNKNIYLLLLAISANAIFLVQPYQTMFKFTGAALQMGAILVLLLDSVKTRNWVVAGVLFGLSTNMHPSMIVAIPFFFIWFTLRRIRAVGMKSFQWLRAPLLMLLVFAVVHLPWNIVKQLYDLESHELMASYLFSGYWHPDGLIATLKLFFAQIPLSEQIPYRLGRLLDSLRWPELSFLTNLISEGKFFRFFTRWSRLEFTYLIFAFYPTFIFLTVNYVYCRLKASPGTCTLPLSTQRRQDLKGLIFVSFAVIVSFILVTYGRHPPDATWAQPFGVTILAHTALLLILLQMRTPVAGAYWAYVALSVGRLVYAY